MPTTTDLRTEITLGLLMMAQQLSLFSPSLFRVILIVHKKRERATLPFFPSTRRSERPLKRASLAGITMRERGTAAFMLTPSSQRSMLGLLFHSAVWRKKEGTYVEEGRAARQS